VGFLQNSKWQEANDAVKNTNSEIDRVKNGIWDACANSEEGKKVGVDNCANEMIKYAKGRPEGGDTPEAAKADGRPLWILDGYLATNTATRDSYNKARIIFFSAAAVSLGISITLFAW